MSFGSALASFFGTTAGTAASAASAPVTSVANLANLIIDRVVPDKAQAAEYKQQAAMAILNGDLQQALGQLEVDKAEASSQSTFVAGWRPFIGWICGFALGYEMIFRPLLTFAFAHYHAVAPSIDTGDLLGLVTAMLGMGAMRSYDKAQGTTATGGH